MLSPVKNILEPNPICFALPEHQTARSLYCPVWWSFVAAGLGLNIHIMYAGECAPQKLRGVIAITASTAIAIGKFIGFALGLR